VIHVSNLYNIKPQEDLAETISKLAGYDLYSFFANSGAEANEAAIKVARKYGESGEKRRYKIITLDNSFHGRTYGSLSATAQTSLHKSFEPMLDGFNYVSDIHDIESAIDDETVAVMLELVKGEGGVKALPKEAVQHLAEELKKRDILLIVDEVQTGVYRTGEFLASNFYDIQPDIITLAKGLAGGVPIGVMATSLKDGFSSGDHGSTFGGNYLSTASALKVLEILENEHNSGDLKRRVQYFDSKLLELLSDFPQLFTETTGVGLMRGLKVNSDIDVIEIVKSGNRERVLTLKSGNNTLRLLPPLNISTEEIDIGFQRLRQGCQNLL
jgi:acetylornithine aminotransferase